MSLHNAQLGSEYNFTAGGSAAAAKQNLAAQHTIGNEYHFAAGGSVAAAKQNFAAQHANRQRISLHCRRFSCGSETEFRCAAHKSAANITSLQQVQLRQRNRISLHNTQFGREYQFAAAGSVAAAKRNFAAQHTNRHHQFQHIILQQHSSSTHGKPSITAYNLSISSSRTH